MEYHSFCLLYYYMEIPFVFLYGVHKFLYGVHKYKYIDTCISAS